MKRKTRICKFCNECKMIYRMLYRPYKLNEYYCVKRDKLTELYNNCELWQKKERRGYDLSAERFEKAEEDIKAILSLTKAEEL